MAAGRGRSFQLRKYTDSEMIREVSGRLGAHGSNTHDIRSSLERLCRVRLKHES